jgi:zinc/manganese transport system permease protein
MESEGMIQVVRILGLPFLACASMTGILGYLGLHVLKREIVFIDIAMAQVAAVGVLGAHVMFGAHGDAPLTYGCAFGLTLVIAAFYAVARRTVSQISLEAIIGVSYAIAAAAALFLLGVAPGGHVHAQHMLAGSILWTRWSDLLVSALVFLLVGLVFWILRRPFGRISEDYDGAVARGMRVVWWDFLFYTLIGLVITLAVRIGGVVVVFAFLIIPATIATMLATRTRLRLAIAWAAGVLMTIAGLVFAHRLDFSVGPSVALFLGIGLAGAWVWRALPPLPAGGITLLALAGFVGLVAAAPGAWATAVTGAGPPPCFEGEGTFMQEGEALERDAASAEDGGTGRHERTGTAQARCEAVLEALGEDPASGLDQALRFLEEDPPLFFRQTVLDELAAGMEPALDYDVMLSPSHPANRNAVARLHETFEKRRRGIREPVAAPGEGSRAADTHIPGS